ncbi:MAG: Smr/MutS family protein [Rhodomicrobium sp.]
MAGHRRKRTLSQEELELWSSVTRSAKPWKRIELTPLEEGAAPATREVSGANPAQRPETLRPPNSQRQQNQHSAPPPASFDYRIGKKIARGQREIDARLDLHGLRQREAYEELRRFVVHCHVKGYRHVLIITGKGGTQAKRSARDFWEAEEAGVLRRLVPHWLSEPVLSAYIVSFTESAMKHGGSGALYVIIRKSGRAAD